MHTVFQSLRDFAHEHDDIPAFHAGYLVLTFLAAAMFNLGAFGILIFIHMLLDFVKYREVHKLSYSKTFEGMLHESLIEVTIFLVALVFSVYLHHSVGLVGVSGLLRAELTIARAAGTLIPKLFILEEFLKTVAHIHHYMEHVHPGLRHGWTKVDVCYMFFAVLSVVLLFAAPVIMNVDPAVVRWVLMWELVPWNI